MTTENTQPTKPRPRWKVVANMLVNIVFGLTMVLMAVMVFFLVQSRLAGEAPQVAGYRIYIVEGGSMEPALSVGGIIAVRPIDPNDIRVGDIITYREGTAENPDQLVTHRIMAVHAGDTLTFTTRGDANDSDDVNPLPAVNVVGEVAFTLPYLGFLFGFVRTRTGLLVMIVVPAVLIIASELRKLIGYAHELEKEEKEVAASKK